MTEFRRWSLLALIAGLMLGWAKEANAQFRRGDVDSDGQVTLFDICDILDYLYEGGVTLACLDAADVNDDGSITPPDVILLLGFLTVPASPPPAAPGPVVCGLDPTLDALPPCVYTAPCAAPSLPPNSRFIRGDCAASLTITIGDPIVLLGYLFAGSTPPPCLDACDANDDGAITIGDAVFLLSFLFSSGPVPPAPFPGCGVDPGDADCSAVDTIACASGPCP